MKEKPAILRLAQYVLKYKYRIILGIFFSLIASITNLISLTAFVPIFNAIGSSNKVDFVEIGPEEKKIYEKYLENQKLETYEKLYVKWVEFKIKINKHFEPYDNKEIVYQIILIVIPIYLLKIISITASIFFLGTAGFYATRDLRNDLYEKLNRLNLSFFELERTGYIMSRVVNDIHLISRSISVEFQEFIVNFFYIITHLILLFLISWKMLLIMFIGVPILMAPVNKFALKVKRAAKNQQERLTDYLNHLQEVISGVRVIRAFAMEDFEEMRFNLINEKLYKDTFRGHYYHQVGPAITELVVTFVVILFLSWGAYEITKGEITKGHFFAFFFTFLFIMRPLIQTSVMLNLVGIVGTATERIFEIFDNKNEFQLPKNPIPFKGLKNSIIYKNVYFTYPNNSTDAYVLKNINLEIKKNQIIALVGESGAGKSTIIDLLLRFYDPNKGEILIDNIDLRKYNIFDIRKKIGIVSQNVFLFNTTIKENITLFDHTIKEEEIIKVCKLAYAHDFIEKLPEGYNTLVGERGVMLSGGQRQRIAIARALIHNPEILILDEATSALDNESEKMVEKAIESAIRDKTVIIIAHRLRTVYKADKIYVIDKGSVLEEGTHQELLAKNGLYKKLYELQFSS
jgi:ATP-binding cassette subfamily B protein/subfamily B ATP-binding cassette protein MsbA